MKANAVIVFLLLVIIGLTGYGIILLVGKGTDQFNQKHIKPFESASQIALPTGSVTIDGHENLPVNKWFEWKPEESHTNKEMLFDQQKSPDLQAGYTYYQKYCQVCHGTGDKKNKWGLAGSKINDVGMVAADLPSLTPYRSDRFIFLKIENGGTVMPRLGHIVTPEVRWQIIAYLRSVELPRLAQEKTDR